MLGAHVLHLALTDAVLAGYGSLHRQSARGGPVDEIGDLLALLRYGAVEHRAGVEVAVADMAHDGCDETRAADVGLGFEHALGQPRYGYANVGREHLFARPRGPHRPVGVVPGLPE